MPATFSHDELLELVRTQAVEHLGRAESQVGLDTSLRDLGADAVDIMEIVMLIEELLPEFIQFPNELCQLVSVRELADAMFKHLNRKEQ